MRCWVQPSATRFLLLTFVLDLWWGWFSSIPVKLPSLGKPSAAMQRCFPPVRWQNNSQEVSSLGSLVSWVSWSFCKDVSPQIATGATMSPWSLQRTMFSSKGPSLFSEPMKRWGSGIPPHEEVLVLGLTWWRHNNILGVCMLIIYIWICVWHIVYTG